MAFMGLATQVSAQSSTVWKADGNEGMPPGSFIGTTDTTPVRIRTDNTDQLVVDQLGHVTLRALSGDGSSFVGVDGTGTLFRTSDPSADSLYDCSVKLWKANGNLITPDCFIGSTNQQPFRVYTHNNERMRVTEIGRVGIGTTIPKSQVQLGDYMPIVLDHHTVSPSDYHRLIGFNTYLDGSGNMKYQASGPAAWMGLEASRNDLHFSIAPSASGGQGVPQRAQLTLDPSGSVGIGTWDQGAQLHIYKHAGTADLRLHSGDPYGNATLRFWAGAENTTSAWQQASLSASISAVSGGQLNLSVNPGGNGPIATQTQLEIDRVRTKIIGKLGVGTEPDPNERMTVDGILRVTQQGTASNRLRIGHDGTNAFIDYTTAASSSNNPSRLIINGSGQPITFGGDLLFQNNVGLGTTNFLDPATGKTYRLSVDGKIRAQEVRVYSGWADYVFEPAYTLMPLSEVEAYITQHGHLPGIPSATQVQSSGLELGDMQTRMMAKIEELTLHLIRLEKENAELRKDVEVMKAER